MIDVKTVKWLEIRTLGVNSVLQFLKEVKGLDLEKEFNDWENADEYTKLNGEVVKRY